MPPTPRWPPNQCIFKGVSRVLRVVLRGPNAPPWGGILGLGNAPCPPPQQRNSVCQFQITCPLTERVLTVPHLPEVPLTSCH